MLKEETLSKLRAITKQAIINSTNNTDEEALETQALYPEWEALAEGTTLSVGDRVNYQGFLYNVLQAHQKQSTWNPVDAPSLFAKVLIEDENSIPEWEQPNSTNPYKKGDKVIFNGKNYVCIAPENIACVWSPTEYPAYWEELL